jgi:phage baseplate assembly protein W
MARKYFAVEDGDLQTRSLVTSRSRTYSDLDLTFTKKPSGDVYKKTDAAAVKQAVKNLLLTTPGEKPFNPYFGGGLNSLLFELANDETNFLLTEYIKSAIDNFEPRAKLLSVGANVNPDSNTARVKVEFQIVNTSEIVTLETTVIRLR